MFLNFYNAIYFVPRLGIIVMLRQHVYTEWRGFADRQSHMRFYNVWCRCWCFYSAAVPWSDAFPQHYWYHMSASDARISSIIPVICWRYRNRIRIHAGIIYSKDGFSRVTVVVPQKSYCKTSFISLVHHLIIYIKPSITTFLFVLYRISVDWLVLCCLSNSWYQVGSRSRSDRWHTIWDTNRCSINSSDKMSCMSEKTFWRGVSNVSSLPARVNGYTTGVVCFDPVSTIICIQFHIFFPI